MPQIRKRAEDVWYVLPRGMRYERDAPTSIDLFVSEMLAHTRLRAAVMAEQPKVALDNEDVIPLPAPAFANTWRRARHVSALAAASGPAALVVQQHLPSAAAIAARVSQPVIFQKHNFIRPPRRGLAGELGKARHLAQYQRLAGMAFVSETVAADFATHWPEVRVPHCIVPNGIDTQLWQPAHERRPLVLTVGRATPEKGLLEAAEGMARVLPERPGWSGLIVMSECDRNPTYAAAVRTAAAPFGDLIQIRETVPPREVKRLNEEAAIVLVPSKWREPFGRTCLEAHAGGAAVVSSGSGGLREISGAHGLYVRDIGRDTLAEALRALIDDAQRRHTMAEAGRKRVIEHFDLRSVARQLDDFLESIISDTKVLRQG